MSKLTYKCFNVKTSLPTKLKTYIKYVKLFSFKINESTFEISSSEGVQIESAYTRDHLENFSNEVKFINEVKFRLQKVIIARTS